MPERRDDLLPKCCLLCAEWHRRYRVCQKREMEQSRFGPPRPFVPLNEGTFYCPFFTARSVKLDRAA